MSDHWHKHYHGRILNSYSKLPVDLRGVAYTLLDMIYDAGGPLADSDAILAAKMCCSLRMWRSYKTRLLQLGKFQLTADGRLTNKLCQEELFRRRKQAEFGSAGGRKKAENQKTRNQFKDGDVGTLQGTLLANQKIEVREEPKGSYSEAKASGADAPRDVAPPMASGGDVWTLAAEAINPDNPAKGRKVVGIINSEEVVAALGGTASAKAAAIMRKAVLETLQLGLTGQNAIEYLRKTARSLATEAGASRRKASPEQAQEPARLFRVEERDGLRYRIDNVTGEAIEIGKVAA